MIASRVVQAGWIFRALAASSLFGALAPSAYAQGAPARATGPGQALNLGVAASGVVKQITVGNGAHVRSGQALLQLDCGPQDLEVTARAAALAAFEAVYERTRNGSRPEEIASGEAAVGVSQARSEEARDSYDRLRRLTVGTTVTQQQLFQAQRDARIAAAQLDDSQKRLALLKAGARSEDVAAAKARRDEAEARLKQAKATLAQCTLQAPVSGTVELNVTLGQFVSAFAPAVLIRLTPDATQR